VHEGEPDFRFEAAGAFAELKLVPVGVYVPGATAASAGTAAKAVTSSESTAIMPIFLIRVFLLYLVGLYPSL
jgi:hypothetical protein